MSLGTITGAETKMQRPQSCDTRLWNKRNAVKDTPTAEITFNSKKGIIIMFSARPLLTQPKYDKQTVCKFYKLHVLGS